MLRTHWKLLSLVLAAIVLVVALGVGAAFAAPAAQITSPATDYHQVFLAKLAQILGVDQQKLETAMTQAQSQTLDQAVNDGRLSQQQADFMKQHPQQAQQGGAPFGPGFGPGPMHGGFGGRGPMSGMIGPASQMMGASGSMGMDFGDEFGYLTWMIPHHQEAITTAKLVLANTQHPELKALAENIVETQTEQVAQMQTWLAAWYAGRDTHVDYTPMMRPLTNLSGDALDQTFLEDMVVHHWWAVWASQKVVADDLYQHQELVPFATVGIRDAQAAQIHTMIDMLSRWYGESPMQSMARIHSR